MFLLPGDWSPERAVLAAGTQHCGDVQQQREAAWGGAALWPPRERLEPPAGWDRPLCPATAL